MRNSEKTKKQILAAALNEFAAKGFDGVSVDQIALTAKVNKAMIYYYFENKAGLFNELFSNELEQVKIELASMMEQVNINDPDQLKKILDQFLTFMESKKDFLGVLMSGASNQPLLQQTLFKLLDVSTELGLNYSQRDGKEGARPGQEELFHELFTGLLPLIYYVLLKNGLQAYYGWDEEKLKNQFIQHWLHQHAGY